MVCYVSLLLFIQFDAGYAVAALLSASLMLPWMLKSFLRRKAGETSGSRLGIDVAELLMFLLLASTAVYLNDFRAVYPVVFVCFFLLSVLCAWHSLQSLGYYECVLTPREQRLYNKTRHLTSQLTAIVTYGVLIMSVGFLEIFFRSINRAWAMANYLLAGGMLVCVVLNLLWLPRPRKRVHHHQTTASIEREWHVIRMMREKPHVRLILLVTFLLLLPQALMFCPRVFFLLASPESGGLGCSLQEVGFAQGTIGVTAFMIGTSLGRYFMQHSRLDSLFVPLSVTLTLSPLAYLLMAWFPQRDNMFALCVMTGAAQFCFGLGLNICMSVVRYLSMNRYRNVSSLLGVPLVVACMIVPWALSGLLTEVLGFRRFFLLDTLTALPAWMVLWVSRRTILPALRPKRRNAARIHP